MYRKKNHGMCTEKNHGYSERRYAPLVSEPRYACNASFAICNTNQRPSLSMSASELRYATLTSDIRYMPYILLYYYILIKREKKRKITSD